MKARRILFALLVATMVLPLFAYAAATPVLFIAGTNDPAVMSANKLVQLTLEKKFNIKLTFSPCPWYNKPDEFRLIIAAGALPDCGWTCLTVKAPELYQMGVIRSIPIEKAEKYAPNYMRKMKERPMMAAWQQLNDKEFYAFYQVGAIGGGGGMSTAVRLDWMENLGIKPKGNVQLLVPAGTVTKDGDSDKDKSANARFFLTDYQYEWNDFVSILEAFVKNDPDKNGKADTYGLSDAILEWMDGYWSFHIFPIDGMNFRWVREPDNSAAPQWYSKAFKASLEMHKSLADRGLMVPDYVTCQYSDAWAYFTSGKAGALGICSGYTGPSSIPPFSVLYENPNAKVLLIPPTKGRTSLDAGFMGGSDIGHFFFNKKLTDKKFQLLLQLFDYMYADDEGSVFVEYGIKDKNYKVEADGTKVFLKEANDKLPPEQRVAQGVYVGSVEMNFKKGATWDLKTRYGLALSYEEQKWPKPEGYYVFFGPGSAATLNAMPFMSADNQKLATEAYRQYVLDLCGGKSDPDTAYQKMMSVVNNLGYQDYLAKVQTSMYIVKDLQAGKKVTPSQVKK